METNVFASLAHLKIIIVPVGSVSKTAFDKWSAVIRTFESIPLVDIPPARQDDRVRFMPTTSSTGHLHLDYITHPPPIWHHNLSLFRPSLFPLGVIGITTCTTSTSLPALQAEFNRKVKYLYPYNSPYPLARSCFAFEESGEHTQLNAESNGLEVIPTVLGNKTSGHIGMLLAGICSQILASFTSLTRALDTPRGWEVLHSSLFPLFPIDPEEEVALKTLVESPRSSSDGKGPVRAQTPPRQPALSRASTVTNRSSTLSSSKKRQSIFSGNGPPNGRLSKTVGDLYLLAGRLSDATFWYNDAINQYKSLPDPVWHAATIEGLCTVSVLEAWAGSSGLQASLSANSLRDPWSEISDRMNAAIYMYFKTTLADGSNDYSLVALLYTSCVLRFTHFLFSIWSSNGWGPMAFLTMLTPSLPPSFHPNPPTVGRRWRMTSMTTITRTQIANTAAQAHGPWIMHLQPHDRVKVLSALAGFYSCLGFARKEVYVLRELVSVLMDLIFLAREERREINAARMGATDIALSELTTSAHVTIREHQLTEGNRSILRLLTYICGVYGVDLKSIQLKDEQKDKSDDEEWEKEAENNDFAKQASYGWAELQLGVVRESLVVAEALSELPALAQFSVSSLRTLFYHLTAPEQYSLYAAAKNAIQVSQRRGETIILEHWSGRPVVSVEVLPLPFSRIPVQHSKSELAPKVTGVELVARDPFIYNPRLKSSSTSQSILVQNEELEFVLTLQNAFLFELELTNVSLSTSGVPFHSTPVSVTIPPNSFCPVNLSGVAEKPGILTIRGCYAQTTGCETREFLLPLSTDEEELRMEKRKSMKEAEADRFKYTGLDARPFEKEKKRLSLAIVPGNTGAATPSGTKSAPTVRFIECKVVPELPFLRIRRTSLTHGAVMMYDGEKSSIRLTVENVSNYPIDFIKLTFDDSTIAPMQQALNEGDLSVFESYETEYDLLLRPVFQWKAQDEPQEIKPGQKTVLTVSCLGKVGCVNGTIQLSYANIAGDPNSEFFYTRQILYPVIVTVNHTLECSSMDILPFSPIATLPLEDEEYDSDEKSRRVLLEVTSQSEWCLFTVDVRNGYTLPFEVHFQRKQEGTKVVSCSRLVPPGSTSRITLPLKRLSLPATKIVKPIPSLSDRQFVVAKAVPGNVDEMMQRELFWYREELFSCISAKWKEPGGARNGELSLRAQRLTGPMLDNLKIDAIQVKLSLIQPQGDEEGTEGEAIPLINGKSYAQPTEFYALQCRAVNATGTSHVLILSLSTNPLSHFHVEGNLTDIPMGRVEPNQAAQVEIPISFVAEGQFEFVGEVHVLGEEVRSGEGELKVIVREL